MSNIGKHIEEFLKRPDYHSILTPLKLMLGDRDKMVALNETLEVYRAFFFGKFVCTAGGHSSPAKGG